MDSHQSSHGLLAELTMLPCLGLILSSAQPGDMIENGSSLPKRRGRISYKSDAVVKECTYRARPAFIVGFWAIAAASFANTGYVSMRTLAQINDCMAEHSVDSIVQVHTFSPTSMSAGAKVEVLPSLKRAIIACLNFKLISLDIWCSILATMASLSVPPR